MHAIKISLICSLGFAVMFGFFSLLFYFGDWNRLSLVTLFGFFIGLIAAPVIEPKVFKIPWLIQVSSAMFAGAIVGWIFQLTFENFINTIIIGGFLGWLAPFWLRHVPIP